MSRRSPLEVALETAREAGDLILRYLHAPLEISEKSARADLVTKADRESEAFIGRRLRDATPSATILGEEEGEHRGTSDERWIVDPLDGTTNFAHAYPLFCVSIAYERAGELLAGVIYAPLMQECFAAEHGAGATFNGQPIHVSSIDGIGDALLCTGFYPAQYERNLRQFAVASERAQAVRRDGAAALDLAYVAAGRFEAFWEFGLHAWDVAAGTLLVREAGGTVTQVNGRSSALDAGSILASNGAIHADMQKLLAR